MRHARALRRLLTVGAPVAFSEEQSSYDPETGVHGDPTMHVIEGHAVELEGSINENDENLTLREALTLLFVPNNIGEKPAEQSTFEWDGESRVVLKVMPLRPAGRAIAAKVIAT